MNPLSGGIVMGRRPASFVILFALLLGCGCAKPRVWQEPRVDLHRYGTLGLVEFDAGHGHGPDLTQRFLASVHAAQAGVPVLEIGALPAVLRSVGHEALTPEAARAIGERYRVDTLVVGGLRVDLPRPSFSVKSFTGAKASAELVGTLHARLLDARSGATIWSDEARGERTVARVAVAGDGRPRFGARDPDDEEAKLVSWLVYRVTDDFRGRWVRP
jgi:hypothetical protein